MKFLRNLNSSIGGCVAVAMIAVMLTLPGCALLAGCTPSSSTATATTTLQKVQSLNSKLPTIKAAIDLGGALVAGLDPATAAQVTQYVSDFDTLEAGLQTQATAYLASPTASALSQIQTQVNTFEASVNTSTLQAAGIKDAATQQKVLAWIKVIATGVTLVFADIATTESAAQLYQLRQTDTIHLARLRPYLDERQLQQQADAEGVDLNRTFSEAERYGF